MFSKIILFIIIFIYILNPITVFAEELKLDSLSGIVIDSLTGRVLYEKKAYVKRPMASTTKIMTCILAIENCSLNETVTVGERPTKVSGTEIKLIKGEELSLGDLLYGMMLPSGNDAAIAIAEHVGKGNYDTFIELMNRKATEIGAYNTHYANPHGLDATGHHTTAYDLALIARYAMQNEVFNNIIKTEYKTIKTSKKVIDLHNTNELLSSYPNADGVKTGYTGNANRCLVGSATKNGFRIISVVLGSNTKNIRTKDSKLLLEYAFNNYKLIDVMNLQTLDTKIPIQKNSKSFVTVKNNTSHLLMPLRDNEISSVNISYDLPTLLTAPIEKGDYIGKAIYKINEEVINEELFFSDITVNQKKFRDYYELLIKNLLKILR